MIKVLVLFTFREGQKEDKLENINKLVFFVKQKAQECDLMTGLQDPLKVGILLSFDQEENWAELQTDLDINDDFLEIISQLEQPPKIYEFSVVE